jgi:ABC-type phosphate/phosphonate transport system substrate-binding protein
LLVLSWKESLPWQLPQLASSTSRFAFNERTSHSGYGVVRHALARRGYSRGFFGSVAESGAHQRSLSLIADGAADASAIDSTVLETEFLHRPDLAQQVRVVTTARTESDSAAGRLTHTVVGNAQ